MNTNDWLSPSRGLIITRPCYHWADKHKHFFSFLATRKNLPSRNRLTLCSIVALTPGVALYTALNDTRIQITFLFGALFNLKKSWNNTKQKPKPDSTLSGGQIYRSARRGRQQCSDGGVVLAPPTGRSAPPLQYILLISSPYDLVCCVLSLFLRCISLFLCPFQICLIRFVKYFLFVVFSVTFL